MPETFHVDIEPEAFDDIQKAVDYYNTRKTGFGKKFFKTLDKQVVSLKRNYHSFAIRYDDIRCMPLKKFPYMVHYRVLEKQKTVSIKAIFCTYENPDKWEKRTE